MSASPVTTEVQVCNLALGRIGEDAISSIDSPQTGAEDKCALHYPMERRALLRSIMPGFARTLAVLQRDSSIVPAYGFANAYKYPNDLLRIMAIGDITVQPGDTPSNLFELSQGYIYCDFSPTISGGLNLQYTADVKRVPLWDSLFLKCMYLSLAKSLAYVFTLKQSLVKGIDDELKDYLLQARAISGQEKPPRRVQRSRVRDVRRAGGIYRDNTRI